MNEPIDLFACTDWKRAFRSQESKRIDNTIRNCNQAGIAVPKELLEEQARRQRKYPPSNSNSIISHNNYSTNMLCIADVEEKEVDWLVNGYLAKGNIALIAGDGGAGKGFTTVDIAAAISRGEQPAFAKDDDTPLENQLVMMFSAEDTIEHVIRRRLRKAGADLDNILSISPTDERFTDIKFNSDFLEALISKYKPSLCIFDPLQSFIPATVKMSERNAMRQCLAPLVKMGDMYGTAFLIVVHTNKRTGAYGRNRIADSADLWDIARSVLIVGNTYENNTRYISHEKCNYAELSDTVLFRIEDEHIVYCGHSHKKDRDFVLSNDNRNKATPARDEAMDFIIEALTENDELLVSDLDKSAKAIGISTKSLRTAKTMLKESNRIKYRKESDGKGSGVKWYVSLA